MKVIVYGARTEQDHTFAENTAGIIIPHFDLDTTKDYTVTCLYSKKQNFKGFEIRQVGFDDLLASYDVYRKRIIKWWRNQTVYWESFNFRFISEEQGGI